VQKDSIKDKITERIYIKGNLELISPLLIGSGQDENTDIDLIRDWDGKPFIPGTAIAGAVRHYLDERADKELVETVFGKKEKDSTQSLISFYDAFYDELPDGELKIQIRDGVGLRHETKTAKDQAKYDYEVLEPGQNFCFKTEIVVREFHAEKRDQIKNLLFWLLSFLKQKKISFGAKTRRGFGSVRLCDEKVLCLNMSELDDVQKWIDFTWDKFEGTENISSLAKSVFQPKEPDNIAEISAEFEIPYSVLIRHYSASPDEPDTTQLSSNEKAVIPGTSWNGAIRHAIYHILKQLNKSEQFEKLTEDLFGYVNEDKKNKDARAKASKIIIKESLIERGEPLTYTRNKTDRFTGGVVDSALFDEMPHYGGKVKLDIAIKKPEKWEIGLMLLALKDMGNGIQPVGGDANVGRGILKAQKISIQSDMIESEGDCLKALANRLQEQHNE